MVHLFQRPDGKEGRSDAVYRRSAVRGSVRHAGRWDRSAPIDGQPVGRGFARGSGKVEIDAFRLRKLLWLTAKLPGSPLLGDHRIRETLPMDVSQIAVLGPTSE